MMLGSAFAKSLRDQRWALLGWGLGVALLVLVEAAVWPTFRDMRDLDQLLAGYPDAMKKLFDLGAMSSGTGFMNAELYGLVLPLLFIVFAVTRGARTLAGEEESGALEVVLATPVSTRSLLLQKAAALAVALAALGLVLAVATGLCSWAFDLGIGPGDLLTGSLALVLLGTEFGWLALAVGAATGRRALALAVGGVAALAAYVLNALGLLVDGLSGWRPLSPFEQALGDGPLGFAPPASLGWVVLVAVLVVAAALPVLDRRDLRSH